MKNLEYNTFEIKTLLDTQASQEKLIIQGHIPNWLHGSFVRNGPVSVKINEQKMPHWFDGPAMLHAFYFQDGTVTYTNKFLKTDALNAILTQGNFNYFGFASLPKHPLWNKVKEFFSFNKNSIIQNANVNVADVAHHTVALTETPLPVRFDVKTLDTLGPLNFQDKLPKENIFESAHPQLDPKTGEQFNYLVEYGSKSKYVIYRYNAEYPKREVLNEVFVQKPSYMHSFAITEHYIILVEFPFIVNPIDLLFMTKPFIKNFYWNPDQGTNFLVIDRITGKLVVSLKDRKPFFAFHHVNAYGENDNIILDIITYPNANIISDISGHGYLSGPQGNKDENLHESKLMRYSLSLKDSTIQSKVLSDTSFELPRINEQYNARAYRYVYGSDLRPLKEPTDLRPIYKIDTQTLQTFSWSEPGLLPGEPVFIPNPKANAEDEGIIVTLVLDAVKQSAFLLMLDGTTFKEIGRAYTPFPIQVGLHGKFFSKL